MLLCTIIERTARQRGEDAEPGGTRVPSEGPGPAPAAHRDRPLPASAVGSSGGRKKPPGEERRGALPPWGPCRRGGRAPVRRVVHYCPGFTRENVNTRVLCSRSDGHTMPLTPSVRLSRSPPHGVTSQVHVFQTTPPRARGSAWPSPTATCSPRAVNLSPPTWRPAGPPRARRRLSPHAPR